MSTPDNKLRISDEAHAALRELVVAFPEWSAAQLGSKLIIEASRAAQGKGPALLATVGYIRRQLGFPADSGPLSASTIAEELAELRRTLAEMQRSQRLEHSLNEPSARAVAGVGK